MVIDRLFPAAALMAVAIVVPSRAFAEDPATPSPQAPPPAVEVHWDNGVSFSSPDGENLLQLGALVQVDGRFDVSDPTSTLIDTFLLRRLRPILQGRLAKYFEFRIMPDFGQGTTVLYDAYFDTKLSNAFRVRAGKDKTPLGYEQLQSDFAVVFPERALVTDLVPNRDIGVQARGILAGGHVTYDGAVFNGAPDGANADLDTNGSKDLDGRLTVKFGGLELAIAGTDGRQTGALPSLKSNAQQTFFSYSSTATANGNRTHLSPAASFYYKAFGAFTEYVRSTQAVSKGTVTGDITNTAWEVTAFVVATGEHTSDRGVMPRRRFDPAQGTWGALQLAARYGSLTVDPLSFTRGLAAAGSSRTAKAAGVDATWFTSQYVKYVLSYERTVFDDNPDGPRKPEHAIIFRLQFALEPRF
jgi:phosphate-selective porin OprO and OprP